MPVNGPGGPTGPRTTSSPSVDSTPSPATPPAVTPSPTTPPTAWTAGGLPPLTSRGDAFGRPSTGSGPIALTTPGGFVGAALPSPVEKSVQTAIDQYTNKLQVILHHDALSMARGQLPTREGDPLTPDQQKQLQDASLVFMKSIPVGALAPELGAAIQERLRAANLSARDINSTTLGDLGTIGQDVAKGLINDLKKDSPAAFYGLAATGAAAAGYLAWEKGSKGLSQLGIKPEFKQKLFDDHLEVKLKGDWQAHFKDFVGTGTVTGRLDLGDAGKLEASVTGNTRTGVENAALDYTVERPNWSLSANATANTRGLESAKGTFTYKPDEDFSLSATVEHNFQTDRTTGNAEATWKLNKSTDFALSANSDGRTSYVGAGIRIHF